MRVRNRIVVTCVGVAAVLSVVVGCCYYVVWSNARGRTYDSVEDVPHNRYGLLLATSPVTTTGLHNFHFDNRIDAATELYRAGKVEYIIASGGDYRGSERYGCDEPGAIRDSLVARGVTADRIILDYDGTRTLRSIEKAKDIYGLDSVTLISQKYHNERALYLADHCGLTGVGYNAAPSPVLRSRIKNGVRECLARVKMFADFVIGVR